MKIYIVGSGGVGGYLGAVLAKAGNEVVFLARGEHYQAIKTRGLEVKSVVGDFRVYPTQAVNSVKEISDPDLIIFAVKTYDTEGLAKQLAGVVNEKTAIITFQNGVGNDEQIKQYLNKAKIYPGVVYIISTKTRPGLIEQTGGLRKFIFGNRKNTENFELKEIEQIFKNAGVDTVLSGEIELELWRKFLFILPFSGMTAICRSPIGKVLADPITNNLYQKCLNEALSVAKVKGVKLEPGSFERIMDISKTTDPNSKSSLLVDIEKGRKTEIETLNGSLVKLAQELDIETPINELIYGAIKLWASAFS
ncbi:MAG: 2-dehydropantoate 2-reductase [Patescibacteria group bacterium]